MRPYMPGYGVIGPDEGSGLLPWSWATERLAKSHDYWVATVRPDGRPHAMPVWGVWDGGAVWFSSSNGARKSRNIAANPWCVVTTSDPTEPVVVEGVAERVVNADAIARFAKLTSDKYETEIPVEFYDPADNSLFRVTPRTVIGLAESDFTGSPTRWGFDR
jgi:PPOX class probable F420-dependent enzyme